MRTVSAMILVVQMLAGVVVPLTHALEPETAPPTIEAHHDASCVVVHDAMRCAVCLYFNSLTPPPAALSIGAPASTPAGPAPLAAAAGMGRPISATAQPRAPPIHLS